MRTFASVLIQRQKLELPFVHNAIKVFFGIILFLTFGSSIETRFFPVIEKQYISDVILENGPKLCWDWNFTKTRDAVLLGAYAQLYSGDRENPMSVGIEREDGTPFGMAGWLNNQIERTCVRIPPNALFSYRLGVRPKLVYKDLPFWENYQDGPWVDYYSPVGKH